jgi:hypothetical protein
VLPAWFLVGSGDWWSADGLEVDGAVSLGTMVEAPQVVPDGRESDSDWLREAMLCLVWYK